jgi:precorrin-6B methylase 2
VYDRLVLLTETKLYYITLNDARLFQSRQRLWTVGDATGSYALLGWIIVCSRQWLDSKL